MGARYQAPAGLGGGGSQLAIPPLRSVTPASVITAATAAEAGGPSLVATASLAIAAASPFVALLGKALKGEDN